MIRDADPGRSSPSRRTPTRDESDGRPSPPGRSGPRSLSPGPGQDQGPSSALDDDRRGVSISVTHVLTLAITALLISGLLIGIGGYLSDFQQSTTREELSAIGERLAGEFVRAETLAQLQYASIELRTNHPQQVGGSAYTIQLADSASVCGSTAPPCFVLASSGVDVSVVVGLRSSVPVSPSAVSGGDLVIEYDGTAISIRGDGP